MSSRASKASSIVTGLNRQLVPSATKLSVPRSAIPFIGLQVPRAAKSAGFLEPHAQAHELHYATDAQVDVIKAFYLRHIQSDWAAVLPALPTTARAILDIGCGLAGIDALLFHHYWPGTRSGPRIYLLDKTEITDRMTYGFSGRQRFYSSLNESRNLLVENGVPADRIHFVEPGRQLAWIGDVDLVLSLASWGFHYPLAAYLDYVRALLLNGGVGITDVRDEKESVETLRSAFSRVEVIQRHANRTRVIFAGVVAPTTSAAAIP